MDKKSLINCQVFPSESGSLLSMSNFVRYSDDSGVSFDITFDTGRFAINEFNIDVNIDSFKKFLSDLILCHDRLSGEVELNQQYEKSKLSFSYKQNGHLEIRFIVEEFDGIFSQCDIGTVIDQTYMNDFIGDLKLVYSELDLSIS